MKNIFFITVLLASLIVSAQSKKHKAKRKAIPNSKIELAKLKAQLSQEIFSDVYVSQESFDKNCCSKSDPNQLDAYILGEYQTIQKDIQACLKIKKPVLKPLTKEERDFETYSSQVNRDLAKVVNDQRASSETRIKAYDAIQRSIKAQNKKREVAYAQKNDRKYCVRDDYQRLLNPMVMKLSDRRGGEAYSSLRKCVSPIGDLYFKCSGVAAGAKPSVDSTTLPASSGSQQ